MKTSVRYACFAAVLLLGCETEKIVFTGPYFVRFTESTIAFKESHSKPIDIEIHNGGPALDEDVLVNYAISGSAREGIDFTIAGESGKVTIPEGEHFGSIQILLINNSNNIIRTQDLVLTLMTANAPVQIGQGKSGMGAVFTFTIIDDCILGGDYIGDSQTATLDGITITSSDCSNYTLSDWNIGVFDTPIAMDLTFIDNNDNTLTIPQQEEQEISEDFATIEGTGVVDPLTRHIVFHITLVDYPGQPVVTINYIPD